MPKKVFISSTCFDLRDARAELKHELESLGYVAYTSETPDFPVKSGLCPADNCLDVLSKCDIYILIIHSRYGSAFDGVSAIPNAPTTPPGGAISITMAEFLVAQHLRLETRVWVRDSIWYTRPIFSEATLPSDRGLISPVGVEKAVYDFLDFVQNNITNTKLWINQFQDTVDLKASVRLWLKDRAYQDEHQFKQEVVSLFELQDYDVDSDALMQSGAQRTLMRRRDDSFETELALWVYFSCSARLTQWADLQNIVSGVRDDLLMNRYEKAFIVMNSGYEQTVQDHLRDLKLHRNIRVLTYSDLISRLINFRPYLGRIVEDFENFDTYCSSSRIREPIISIMSRCDLYKYYVPLRAHAKGETAREIQTDLESYVMSWLNDSTRNLLTILGDFGTGKSSFALRLTYTLAKRILEFTEHGVRIPVFVSLRDHVGKIDIREIITNTLSNIYGIRSADFRSFERLLEAGRLLVIFDGFDETATLTDRATSLRILRSIHSLVRRNSKVILTCRTHFFRSDQETHRELQKSLPSVETELFAEQKGRHNFEVITLQEFRRDQIELFLEKHYGSNEAARSTLAKMQSTYNLPDLSKRPVMLEMIIKVWPRLMARDKSAAITPALLYSEYVQEWLRSVAKGNEDLMDPDTKLLFCCSLTRWMYIRNCERLPFEELEAVVQDFFKGRPPSAYAALDVEVRTCTFLNRDSVGNYQFAHRSFLEYFVAKAFADEITNGEYELFRERPITPEIMNFLKGLIFDADRVRAAVLWTRGKSMAESGYVGGNAISLLVQMGANLRNADFSQTVLQRADFTNTDLTGMNVRGAILKGSRLFNATLDMADMRDADLRDINISEFGAVACIAWSTNGETLAVGGEDRNIRLLDCNSRQLIGILRGHSSKIMDLKFVPGRDLLLSVASEIIIWDVQQCRALYKWSISGDHLEYQDLSIESSQAFVRVRSSDMKVDIGLSRFPTQAFYSNVGRYTLRSCYDRAVCVEDWAVNGKIIFKSPPHDTEPRVAAFSSNDSLVAVGTQTGRVYLWDTFTGNPVTTFDAKPITCKEMQLCNALGCDAVGHFVRHDRTLGSLCEWFLERGAIWPEAQNAVRQWKQSEKLIEYLENKLSNSLENITAVSFEDDYYEQMICENAEARGQLRWIQRTHANVMSEQRSLLKRLMNIHTSLGEKFNYDEAEWNVRHVNMYEIKKLSKSLSKMISPSLNNHVDNEILDASRDLNNFVKGVLELTAAIENLIKTNIALRDQSKQSLLKILGASQPS
jgi:archaellum biogenesis ATPase FlaH